MFNYTSVFSSYSVDDLTKALGFYKDVLGLNVTQTPEGLDIKLKGGDVFLYPKDDHIPATFTVLNLVVEDIDQAVDALIEKGVTFERYDMGEMAADAKGIYRGRVGCRGPNIAWFKDPAGNILSVIDS